MVPNIANENIFLRSTLCNAGWVMEKAAAAFIADFFIKALAQRSDSSLFIFHLDDIIMISVIIFSC